MAVLASIATGNFTSASTWGLVDSTSYLNSETGSDILTTAYSGTRSSAFTPGAIVVSHIGVKLSVRTGTTGTISVQIEKDSDDSQVAGTEVTIDCADLPAAATASANGGWVFFKLASPVTLAGATAYQIAAKTSSASQVSLFRDSTTDNLSRALITTTTQAPVAGDDVIIAGEHTGSGTGNSFVVTMNSTAATDYGAASTSLVTPALSVCKRGTLRYGASAATNYVLRLSGNAIVYSAGTFEMGTTGTPMPRDSTAVLEFDCAADGDFTMYVRNGGTCTFQGQSRTSGKNIVACMLNTDEAANSTSLGVDTDTGWLDNDEIVVVSTTRTATQTEKGALNGNAGASTLTVDGFGGTGGGLANAHSGTSPTQAEVVLLTRNVKFRSVSTTAMTALFADAGAVIDFDWVEFRYIGTTNSSERGIEISTATASGGSCTIDKCSMYDCDGSAIYVNTSVNTVTIDSNIIYNASVVSGADPVVLNSGITFSNNYVVGCSSNISNGAVTFPAGITSGLSFTGNIIAGNNDQGIAFSGAGYYAISTMSNNIVHSNNGNGWDFDGGLSTFARLEGTITGGSCYRNGGNGFNSIYAKNLTIASMAVFGNTTNNFVVDNSANLIFDTITANGDTTFSTSVGILLNAQAVICGMKLINCDFSTVTGIKTAHTTDISFTSAGRIYAEIYGDNTKLGAATEVGNLLNSANSTAAIEGSFYRAERHDQTDTTHKTIYKYGTVTLDTSISRTASPSERLTPDNASNKMKSGVKKVAVADGATVTISVYMRESVVGDGTDYNGNRPRLILKRNEAMGITSDTVIDTGTVSAEGAFEQLTGTTSAVIDDGILEFYVDCDGTTGWVNVDDWSVS